MIINIYTNNEGKYSKNTFSCTHILVITLYLTTPTHLLSVTLHTNRSKVFDFYFACVIDLVLNIFKSYIVQVTKNFVI